jgi:hypothetical protein
MNPASNQPEHARRRRPTHGSSRVDAVAVVVGVGVVAGVVAAVVGVGVVGGVLGVLVVVLNVAVIRVRNRSGRGRSADQRGSARPVLRIASGLLRDEARAEWLEESEVWLLDLREAGEPWYRLLAEQLSILTRLPWLVMIHWLSARRAVDR